MYTHGHASIRVPVCLIVFGSLHKSSASIKNLQYIILPVRRFEIKYLDLNVTFGHFIKVSYFGHFIKIS